jgi:dTDP-glucose 4,6-dehydratase
MTLPITGAGRRWDIDVVNSVCPILDRVRPRDDGAVYCELIQFVPARPGHDRRFGAGIEATVRRYLDSSDWQWKIQERGYAGKPHGFAFATAWS